MVEAAKKSDEYRPDQARIEQIKEQFRLESDELAVDAAVVLTTDILDAAGSDGELILKDGHGRIGRVKIKKLFRG